MDTIKNVQEFKLFLKENKEKFLAKAEKAEDILVSDEWMQEDRWDEIFAKEEKLNDKV